MTKLQLIRPKKKLGFTLVEVMITVTIVGILAAVTYPSYVEHVTRSNRAEALRHLTHFANLEEQFFVDNRVYTGSIKDLGIGSGTTYTTDSGNYKIKLKSFDAASGTFKLQAKALSTQLANDPDCKNIYITDTGAKTPTKCWEQ